MSCKGASPHCLLPPAPLKAMGESGPSGLRAPKVQDGGAKARLLEGSPRPYACGSSPSAVLCVSAHSKGLPERDTGQGITVRGLEVLCEQVLWSKGC